jgi:hypothetical protein
MSPVKRNIVEGFQVKASIDMTNIPSPPSSALNRIAWTQAVAIAAGLPFQPTCLEWVDEAAQERSVSLKCYYELIKVAYEVHRKEGYRYEGLPFLAELWPRPVDLLDAIATNLLEEYQGLRAYPEEEFPGRRAFIDGGRTEARFLNGGLAAESLPSGKKGYAIFAGDLRQWGKKIHGNGCSYGPRNYLATMGKCMPPWKK